MKISESIIDITDMLKSLLRVSRVTLLYIRSIRTLGPRKYNHGPVYSSGKASIIFQTLIKVFKQPTNYTK